MNEAMTPAELKAECASIKAMLPNKRADVTVSINSDDQIFVGIYPEGVCGQPSKFFSAESFSDVFAAASEWCAAYPDERRAEVERKLREAQAELHALNGGDEK